MLRYGLGTDGNKTLIEVEFDEAFKRAAQKKHGKDFKQATVQALDFRTIKPLPAATSDHIWRFDFGRALRKRRVSDRQLAYEATSDALVGICNTKYGQGSDPYLSVGIGTTRLSDRLGMRVDLSWPEGIADKILAELATDSMRRIAKQLHYPGDEGSKYLDDLVYAQVNREQGITLQTNPVGSCSIDTVGDDYDQTAERVELWAHNIYNRDQQIICLAGAIAIAHAAELV